MASLLWTRQHKSSSRAPSSIFSSNSNLSPRQVANKAYSLAIKKLDRDDKRSRPQYNVRERLLLCNTLCKAEQFLQKRTARTNRRVMAFEDDDVISPLEDVMTSPPSPPASDMSMSTDIHDQSMDHQYDHHVEHPHSPLCHIEETDDEEEDDDDDQPKTPDSQQQQQQQPITSLDMALASKSLSPMGDNAFVIPQDDEDFLQHPSSYLIPSNSTVVVGLSSPR